jgi:hypothetical protein
LKKLSIYIIFAPWFLFSYELGMLNLNAPSVLNKSAVEISIMHRFYGVATKDPLNTLAGIEAGANVAEGIRYCIFNGLEAGGSYIRDQKEYKLDIGYTHLMPKIFLRSRIDVEFFGYKDTATAGRVNNLFPQATLQGVFLNGRIKPIVSAGFDGEYKKPRFGLGLSATILKDIGWYIKETGLLFEYFPVARDSASPSGAKNCFSIGFAARTHGHQFIFLLGNTYEIGTRQMMVGSPSNDLHFGFNIRRLFGA